MDGYSKQGMSLKGTRAAVTNSALGTLFFGDITLVHYSWSNNTDP